MPVKRDPPETITPPERQHPWPWQRSGRQLTAWGALLLAVLLVGPLTGRAQTTPRAPLPSLCWSDKSSKGALLTTTEGSQGVLRILYPTGLSTVRQRFSAPVVGLRCHLDDRSGFSPEQDQIAALTADGRVWLGVPGRMTQIARARGSAPYLLFWTRDPREACEWRNHPDAADCPTHLVVVSSERSLLGQPGTRVEIMTPRSRFLGRTVKSWRLPNIEPARIDIHGFLGQRDGHVALVSWLGHEFDRSRGPGPDDAGALHAINETRLYTGIERGTGRAWLVQADGIDVQAPRLDVTLPGPPMAQLPLLIPDDSDVPETVSVFGRERVTGRWRGWHVQLKDGKVRSLTLPAVQGTVVTIVGGHFNEETRQRGLLLVTRLGDTYHLQSWTP